MDSFVSGAGGVLVLLAGRWFWVRSRRWVGPAALAGRLILAGALALSGLGLFTVGGYLFWFSHRPLPAPVQQTLFEGITYTREVRREPRPLVIHVVSVDLDTPGLNFLVTPGEAVPGGEIRARTTSAFLQEFQVQFAINGSDIDPWYSISVFDSYPRSGDPVDVRGLTSSQGVVYSQTMPRYSTFYLSSDNQASFRSPLGTAYNAISGDPIFLERGTRTRQRSPRPDYYELHPRTALAVDESGRKLLLFVVDGRQPNYSEGVTIPELANIVFAYGGYTALNLDGGGSSTLVMQTESGQPVVLNSPIENLIPGRERPVANHLGIYARRTDAGRGG